MNNKDELKKIYLAIPYSQIDLESSHRQANEAAALILNDNYNVFSPISHCHVISQSHKLPGTWDFWKKIDYQFIDWADEIWVLIPEEGNEVIEKSTGVQAEIIYGIENKKVIRFFEIIEGKLVEQLLK